MSKSNEGRITELETKLTKLRAANEGLSNFNADRHKQITEADNELRDLKDRSRRESAEKDRLRRKFLSTTFGSPADFERIYSARLRDELLVTKMLEETRVTKGTHPIYQNGLND